MYIKVSDAHQKKLNRVKKQLAGGGGGGDDGGRGQGNPVFTELYKRTGSAKLDAVKEYVLSPSSLALFVVCPCGIAVSN